VDNFERFLWRLGRHILDNMAPELYAEPEPYVELNESDGEVVFTAELPNVQAKDLTVALTDRNITVNVSAGGEEEYSESFDTPKISPQGANITFRNGILHVKAPLRKTIF